jgi:predicted PurR-regulated permease PerM
MDELATLPPTPTAPRQPYLPPLAILAVLALIGTVTFLGPVIKPVLVAVFLFFIIQPAAQWLIDRGISSWVSYLILFFVVFVLGALVVRVTYSNLYDLQSRLPQYEKRALELLSHLPGLEVEQFRRPRAPEPVNWGPIRPAENITGNTTGGTDSPPEQPSAMPAKGTVQGQLEAMPAEVPAPEAELGSEREPDAALDGLTETDRLPIPLLVEDSPEESDVETALSPKPGVPAARPPTAALDDDVNRAPLLPRVPPQDQLESKTIFEIFNVTSEAIGEILVGTAVEWLEAGLMVLFYLIFVILDAHRLPSRIRRALPETGEQVVEMGRDINQSITNYMQVKTLVSLGMAVTGGMLMAGFQLDNWPLWALLMFLFNYITYVGSLGALVPPIVIAVLQFESFLSAAVLAILISLNRFFWIDYVEIRYAGKRLSINAVLLLLSLAYWGRFWGVTGLVLAVPMLTAAKIALEKFPSTRNWAMLISED